LNTGAQYTMFGHVDHVRSNSYVWLHMLHLTILPGHYGRHVENLQVSCHVGKQRVDN
jgi:hypothetical protein